MIEERDGSNNLIVRYDYGDDIIRLDRSSGVYYYISDGLGSTRQLVDSTGAVQDSDTYDAFGNLAASSGSVPNWFLFNEQQLDPTGLYNLRARYMDPTRGEFLGQDPADGDMDRPLSLHRYLYASDNAVNRIDPSGKGDFSLGSELTATSIAVGLASLSLIYVGITGYVQTGLEVNDFGAFHRYYPNITSELASTVRKIKNYYAANPDLHETWRKALTDPNPFDDYNGYGEWDIEQLTNATAFQHDIWITDSSNPKLDKNNLDARLVRVDGNSYHDYSVNYVAFGVMMQLTGYDRTAVQWAVRGFKSFYAEKDEATAEAWALAGYDGWPDSAASPPSDIITAGDSGGAIPTFEVEWSPRNF